MYSSINLRLLAASALVAVASTTAQAGLINDGTWSGWTVIADDDKTGSFYFVDPGYGGQAFDAEYLLFRQEGNTLSIGLQTGFDVVDGHQLFGGENYWGGDLFLTFGGSKYAVDFGFANCDYSDRNDAGCSGADTVGLYEVTSVNNDIYFGASADYQMASGVYSRDILTSFGSGVADSQTSYFRTATFDISGLDLADVAVHWTMSCGNDAVDGRFGIDVPEPSSLALLGLGLVGLSVLRKRNNG